MGELNYNREEVRTVAKLDDGRLVIYHNCSEKKDIDNSSCFNYLGQGIIHSVNGAIQDTSKRYYFYVRNSKHILFNEKK